MLAMFLAAANAGSQSEPPLIAALPGCCITFSPILCIGIAALGWAVLAVILVVVIGRRRK